MTANVLAIFASSCARILGGRFLYLVLLLFVAGASGSQAQTFTTLASFNYTDGGDSNAAPDFGSLVQGFDGNLYGTTEDLGATSSGNIFRITTSGALRDLYNFCSQANCSDGSQPYAGVIQGRDGNLYGTNFDGGVNGQGTVFKITPSGTLTTLYSFCGQPFCQDGAQPAAALTEATDGNFYGTTFTGGISGAGTVYRVTPSGSLTTLWSFCSSTCTDGASPYAGLIQANNGSLYGSTYEPGAIFRVTLDGTFTVLSGAVSSPYSLIQGADGNLYGTTGGLGSGGSVFKLTLGGAATTLYNFCSLANCADGSSPSGLTQATDGNFYGTTAAGGANGFGTIFSLTPSGVLSTLHNFCAKIKCVDGSIPLSGVVQATNGVFYGKTVQGGSYPPCQCGTVFSLSVGLGPFVETLPSSGKVGAPVIILGTNLTGATAVNFNGTAATFTVVSGTQVKATVPTGAKRGNITVVTPSGTLTSNVVFVVRP